MLTSSLKYFFMFQCHSRLNPRWQSFYSMLFLTLIYTAFIFLCLRASVHVWGYITCPEPLIGRVKENIVNNPCPITPPSRHHLYIIHLIKKGIPCINKLHCFYRITIPLKLPLVPKRDVKQCPTINPTTSTCTTCTTTTTTKRGGLRNTLILAPEAHLCVVSNYSSIYLGVRGQHYGVT